jgi:hypothetical protein
MALKTLAPIVLTVLSTFTWVARAQQSKKGLPCME